MDFALVEIVDIDVVVVIRFVAMENIPRESLAQGKPEAKLKIAEGPQERCPEDWSGSKWCPVLTRVGPVRSLAVIS